VRSNPERDAKLKAAVHRVLSGDRKRARSLAIGATIFCGAILIVVLVNMR